MKLPIPAPKQIFEAEGKIPAVTERSFYPGSWDPEFDGAVRAYRKYAKALSASEATPVTLKKEPLEDWDYLLQVTPGGVTLTAADNEGMNHGFATLLQITETAGEEAVLPCCEIRDKADSGWRGLMLDLARCWHEAEYLFRYADLCWLYKASRLQLHLNDDQAVRFPFKAFPEAVSEEHYTEEELKALIAYCNDRGIVLVPEIDAPGHAAAFTDAYPEIFGRNRGLMCAEEKTFSALQTVYREVAEAFPDSPYLHVGGDEAAIAKWETCEDCEAYRTAHGLKNAHMLYGHYIKRLCEIVKNNGKIPVVWEGFSKECNDMIPKDALVFAWESYYQLAPDLLAAGFTVLNASWKPNYVVTGSKMWDPEEILRWEKNKWDHWWEESIASRSPIVVPPDSAIEGGQICSWGDKMTPRSAYAPRKEMCEEEFSNLSLRLPALCEKLWNSYTTPDPSSFRARLTETERLLRTLF